MISKTRKIAFAVSICLFLSVLIVSAVPGDNLDFGKLKENTLSSIERAINKINNAKNTINNNPLLEAITKENTISKLTDIEEKLIIYNEKVENTTNISGLNLLSKEIIKFLKDNKEIVKNNVRMSLVNLGQKVSEKSEEFGDKTEVLITALKIKCTDQTSKTIVASIEVQLTQLDSKTETLKQAISTKDTSVIKQEVKKIKELSKNIVDNLKTLKEAC